MSDMAEGLNIEEFLDSVVIATRKVIIPPEDDQFLEFMKTKNSELSKFNINNCETEMLAVDLRSFKLNAESSDYFQDVELGGPTGFPGNSLFHAHHRALFREKSPVVREGWRQMLEMDTGLMEVLDQGHQMLTLVRHEEKPEDEMVLDVQANDRFEEEVVPQLSKLDQMEKRLCDVERQLKEIMTVKSAVVLPATKVCTFVAGFPNRYVSEDLRKLFVSFTLSDISIQTDKALNKFAIIASGEADSKRLKANFRGYNIPGSERALRITEAVGYKWSGSQIVRAKRPGANKYATGMKLARGSDGQKSSIYSRLGGVSDQ